MGARDIMMIELFKSRIGYFTQMSRIILLVSLGWVIFPLLDYEADTHGSLIESIMYSLGDT
jgi:hypothetical protein